MSNLQLKLWRLYGNGVSDESVCGIEMKFDDNE